MNKTGDAAKSASNHISESLTGRTLSSILSTLDHHYFQDHSDFDKLSRQIKARDQHIIDCRNDIISLQGKVKDALKAARSTAATLKTCRDRQTNIERMLTEFEEVVHPVYQRSMQYMTPKDNARVTAYKSVLDLSNDVLSIEQKIEHMIDEINYARRELEPPTDVDCVVNLVDSQLSAMEQCTRLATTLEQELNMLLGKPVVGNTIRIQGYV